MENEDFIDFVSSLNSAYKLPSRESLRGFILKEAEIVKKEVFSYFFTHSSFFFLTNRHDAFLKTMVVSATVSIYGNQKLAYDSIIILLYSFFISLTLKDYYLSITIHFINSDWKLISYPVAFAKVVGPHTAEAIGHLVGDLLSPYLGNNFYYMVLYLAIVC